MKRYKKLTTTIPYMRNPKSIFHDDYCGRESIEQMEIENKMVEHPQGEWIKWEDVENLQSQAYETGYFTGENTEKVRAAGYRQPEGILEIKEPKCNCVEKLRAQRNWWICPAHGYKKR